MSIERHKKMFYFFHDIGNKAIDPTWFRSTPLLTINDPAEDDVFVVEEVALGGRHEELATVRVLGGKEICTSTMTNLLYLF